MNKLLLIVLLCVFTISAFAQNNFRKGYFIGESGNRTECLIRNEDRRVNPFQFEYKLTEDAAVEVGTLSTVKQFEILNTIHKYQRFEVKIDRSSDDANNLSASREPEFKTEKLFLRVLVEGEASLYYYAERGGLKRFFIKMNNSEVEQLVYKRYTQNQSLLGTNDDYKQQLLKALTCRTISDKIIDDLYYQQKDLVSLFVNYNECVGSEAIDYTEKKEKGDFALAVKAGVNFSALETEQMVRTKAGKQFITRTHDMVASPQVGIEAGYTFTFNNGRWTAFTQPTYQQFKYSSDLNYTAQLDNGYEFTYKGAISVDYSHISIPVGIRYAVLKTEHSRFSLHGAAGVNFLVDNDDAYKELKGFNGGVALNFYGRKHFQTPSFILGMGYQYRNRFSLDAGYHLSKAIVTTESWKFKFVNSVSIVLGYSLF